MSEKMTCGKGLAARASLPAKLAELTAAMAEILAYHQRSLDPQDGSAADQELQTYAHLEQQFRAAASLLTLTAGAMAGSRDLPMPAHGVRVLASAENASIFERFVKIEEELVSLLGRAIETDRAMSKTMRESARGKV
jgi:hypothetical protein